MIMKISWHQIESTWRNKLWPQRQDIHANSAMNYLNGHSAFNMTTTSTFFGFLVDGEIVGVNSGHMCESNQYRSRGLWVDEEFRGCGYGVELLAATIKQGIGEGASLVWSLPRQSSWGTYSRAGFELASGWFSTETSISNAYCVYK